MSSTSSVACESPPAGTIHIPASPGPYASPGGPSGAAGPAAVITLSHDHFLITMTVTTTFKPSAVLPTIYALLPQAQLQCDHFDLQMDEQTHKLRVQIVGVVPPSNVQAVANLGARLKSLQPGATVVVKSALTQMSVDSDSISAVSSLLMSSQSRALLDQHVQYYRLHSHPTFIPQLLIYLDTRKCATVIQVLRNFMADPAAGGAVRPPRPNGLEIKGEEPAAPAAATAASGPPATPEKERVTVSVGNMSSSGVPQHRTVQSSSRSPHFKAPGASSSLPPLTPNKTASSLLPPSSQLESALSANALAATFSTSTTPSGSSSSAPVSGPVLALTGGGGGTAAPVAPADSAPATAPRPTSVAETVPIRLDNKWWSSKRPELLRLLTQHSLKHDALYVYSRAQFQRNISELQSLRSIDRIFYACKANHQPDLLRAVHDAGLGFECVSIQELKHIHEMFPGLPRERLLFTPNFAAKMEYEEAYFYTDYVNLDNIYPLESWPELFKNRSVMLRMDPGEGLGYHSKMRTGGARSKFGVSVDQLHSVLPTINSLGIKVIGLHVHKGSGIHDAGVWAQNAAFLASLMSHFPHLRILDLGGGLGVGYRDTDPLLDLQKLDKELQEFRAALPEGRGKDLQLWLEPGRFLVASAGVLLASVTQLKHKPGRDFVGLSTGMNSLIRPALYESHHDIINLSRLDTHAQPPAEAGRVYLNTLDPRTHRLVDVVGPICETGDVLGEARSLPSDTAEGDVILIDTAGAYGHVMGSFYNMRPAAGEVLFEDAI